MKNIKLNLIVVLFFERRLLQKIKNIFYFEALSTIFLAWIIEVKKKKEKTLIGVSSIVSRIYFTIQNSIRIFSLFAKILESNLLVTEYFVMSWIS